MKRLIINGEVRETASETLPSLFSELGLPAPLLLVEHNGTALTRSEWDDIVLAENDRLEVMSVAAGG
jgi:thiamine biosynthesis protein ThiS